MECVALPGGGGEGRGGGEMVEYTLGEEGGCRRVLK